MLQSCAYEGAQRKKVMKMRWWTLVSPPSCLSYMGSAVSLTGEEMSGPGTGKTTQGRNKEREDGK